MQITINQHWDGTLLALDDCVPVEVSIRPTVTVRFNAKFSNPSIPVAPPGFFDGLWGYDVVEVFVAGSDGRYLEIEVGPGGHWLAYWFESYRKRADDALSRDGFKIGNPDASVGIPTLRREDGFSFPASWLTTAPEACLWNFYVIRRTVQGAREYLAWKS